jgi:plasmid segregation protein ParM
MLSEEEKRIIHTTVQEYVESMIEQLEECDMDFRKVPSIWIGGGAHMLKKYILASKRIVNAEFIEDTLANAKGYAYIENMGG